MFGSTWRLVSLAVCVLVGLGGSGIQSPAGREAASEDELSAFVARVLERREVNWAELYDYVFREREVVELRSDALVPEQAIRREFVWFVRDGYLVRSPDRFDGARVDAAERRRYEDAWIADTDDDERRQPLAREGFFEFVFKEGHEGEFLVAGREKIEGRNTVVLEYYPRRLFADLDDEDEDGARQDGVADEFEHEFTRMLDKTSLVRLWVLPEQHQIVRMTFENVGLDFLPLRWLVRVDDFEVTMTMGEPIAGIWLPARIAARGQVSTAAGFLQVVYLREFYDYRRTDVQGAVRFGLPEAVRRQRQEQPGERP